MIRRIEPNKYRIALGRKWRKIAVDIRRFVERRPGNSPFQSLERAPVVVKLSPAEADALAREAVRAFRSNNLR